ncbi:MAG: MmcB family DNA repair protein [Paracoccus sp. (in: a-proteobacteria)]|uniref:MmcB family DNA repair protein n=1 Tax=Paracoccus sp. TaxID=267 RepID=UPI0026DF7436|nr:MmcB family DNA repair protein [Paracoccus sp. (in: a-proteobacteria)]MDO5621377.1 MmcB family DNA repair protein [Paracoccus sp. (in: a-proteobacteria)]
MENGAPLLPGPRLQRGVARLLHQLGHAPLTEFVPAPGLRLDVISVGPQGDIWVIECKSSRTDFISDRKWPGYLEWADRFFWACDSDFPKDLFPADHGLILADAFGAEIARMAPESRLAAARRNRLIRDIARVSTARLLAVQDPLGISAAS